VGDEDPSEWTRTIIRWSPEWANNMLDDIEKLQQFETTCAMDVIGFRGVGSHIWVAWRTDLWEILQNNATELIPEGPILQPATTGNDAQLILPDFFSFDVTVPEDGSKLSERLSDRVEFERAYVSLVTPSDPPGLLRTSLYYDFSVDAMSYQTGALDIRLLQRAAGVKMT
jgi:hypothetical protein